MKLTKRIVAFVLVAVMLVSACAVMTSASASVSMSYVTGHNVTSDGAVKYAKYNTYGSSSGHTEATTVLTFNPSNGYIPMAFVKSAGWASTLDKQYSEAINKYGYEVAGVINGSFFSTADGTLCGNLIVDGKVSCAHVDYADSFVAFDSEGNMDIVNSCLAFTLRINGTEVPNGLAYLNKRQDMCGDWGSDRFFYYDTSCGSAADSSSQGLDIICEKIDNSELAVGKTLFGKVVAINQNTYGSSFGTSGQLSNRFVLSVKNGSAYAAYANGLKVGDSVSITTTETVEASREIMEKANSVITNVGWLVKNGVDQTDINSSIGTHAVTTYARWTAFGRKANGEYVFFTSEGGSTGVSSRSINLKDVAAAMIKLGCTDVIRMDGGGSSAMYVSNTGSGSAGYVQSHSRSVSDCILIVKKSSLVDSSLNAQLRTYIDNAKNSNPTAEVSAIIAEAEACLAQTYPVSGDVKRYLMDLSPMASLGRALTRADSISIGDYNAHVLNELRTYYDQGAAAFYKGNTSADIAGLASKINAALDKKTGASSVSVGASYTVTNTRTDVYKDNGTKLTDGNKGAVDAGSGSAYSGFTGNAEVVIDLGSAKTFNTFNVYLAGGAWGITVPTDNMKVDVSYSNSKSGTYTTVGSVTEAVQKTGTGKNDETWSTYTMTLSSDEDITARYVKIKVTNTWGGHVWMDEVEVAYKADAGAYSAPVTDYIFVTKFNEYVYGGDCIVYTPDFGTITEDKANHRYTVNVLLEWNASVGAYVVKSVAQGSGAGTVPAVTLSSNQLYIACHAEDSRIPGSGINATRLSSVKPGQKMLCYGIDITNKTQSCAAYIKFIDANATDPDLVVPCEHDYEGVVTAPTCKEGGYTTFTCSLCGDSYVGDETDPDANAHNPGEAATCTKAQTCLDCGATVKPMLDHDYNTSVTAPTCEDEGYTTYSCKNCTHSYVDDYVDALGHDYKDSVTAPTCTEKGYTTHTCDVCGDSYVDSYVDEHGHTEGEWVTLENGSQELRCTVCGEILETKPYVPAVDYDVNGDGKFNLFDYVAVKNAVIKGSDDPELLARADVNGDGRVNIFDCVAVKGAFLAQG